MGKIKAVCFDMFWTLVNPKVELEPAEYEPFGLTPAEYGRIVWGKKIGKQRGNGTLGTAEAIMERICSLMPMQVTPEMRAASYAGKTARMKDALTDIDPKIIETLKILKDSGYKLGLISNADAFDDMFWDISPLKPFFDDAIFSYRVRMLKPSKSIYKLSLKNLGVSAKEAVFVGDGGSDEHHGAKRCGMTSVWTEYLHRWDDETRENIEKYADHHIDDFADLPAIIGGI